MTRLCTAVAIVSLGCLAIAQAAVAGTYEVRSCEEDVRTPMHYNNWALVGSPSLFRLEVNCTVGPTRLTTGAAFIPPGAEGRLRFRVNPPLIITELKYRQLINAPASLYPPNEWWWDFETYVTGEDGITRLAAQCPGKDNHCDERYAGATIRDARHRGLEWVLRCSPSSPKPCGLSEYTLLEATFKLEDPINPRIVARPGGELFAGQSAVSGVQAVTFDASDAGSGLQRAVLEVDGVVVAETMFSTSHPSCVAPYTVPQPCPLHQTASLAVDTTQYVDGQHQARLLVFDATGTNHAAYGPVAFTTRNHTLDSYCATQDARRFRLFTPRKATRFGSRSHIRASVTSARGWEALLLAGTRRVEVLARGTISPRNRFVAKLAPGINRTLRLAVRPPGATGRFICSRARRLKVRAKVSLRVSPRRSLNGRAITIRGRVHGKSNQGKALIVQARAVGNPRWATVRVVRTRADGAYRMRYRFLRTFAAVTYIFRTQVRAERGYPYATGYSRDRRVRVVG